MYLKSVAVVLGFVCLSVLAKAGDEPQQVILTEEVPASFGKVWDAIKTCMDALGCAKPQVEKITEPAEEGGFYTGVYVSDFCVIAKGEDTTKKYMEQFGEIPRIRSGIWIAGRIQYKINVKETGVRETKIILRAELSGFEEFITNHVYFWTSNGILEHRMMDAILAKVKQEVDEIKEN